MYIGHTYTPVCLSINTLLLAKGKNVILIVLTCQYGKNIIICLEPCVC